MADKKFSILLVEDEENLQEALKLNLELEGYEITSAYDGAEALKAVTKEHFDLIILDVMLPELDGITVCETVRLSNPDIHPDIECKEQQCRPGAWPEERSR